MHKNKNTSGFTLIETLVGVLIFSMVIVAGFSALSAIVVGKVKLIEKTAIQKEAFYFSEKLFEMIKTGGTIDYEEYWNRYSYDTTYGSGHFLNPTGFGNFGGLGNVGTTFAGLNPYYCLSSDAFMGYSGCLITNNVNTWADQHDVDYSNSFQRYTQYSLQFIDFNSDADFDVVNDDLTSRGNEDNSADPFLPFIGDDDDLYLGAGPEAFPLNVDVGELYLINASGDERTYFRHNVVRDPNSPASEDCTGDLVSGEADMVGGGCLGTIEFLRLTGEDAGYDHAYNEGQWDNDGKIDTWLIHNDFHSSATRVIAGTDGNNYWQPLFPDTLHVKDVQFFPYPNKNLEYSWRDSDASVNISPYVRISMTLTPSWKSRKKIRGKLPEIEINTTVQLTDIFN